MDNKYNFIRSIGIVIALICIFYVLGKLCLLFVIPTGFATPIWLPSGIAAAGLILYGKRYWAGVFVGSFLLNIEISAQELSFTGDLPIPILVSLAVATGATIQALMGWCLVYTYLEQSERSLETGFQISKVIVICLIVGALNAVLSTLLLFYFDIVRKSEILFHFFNWWTGDFVGLILIVPVTILFLHKKNTSVKRIIHVLLSSMIILCLLVLVFLLFKNYDEGEKQIGFEQQSEQFVAALQSNLQNFATALHATRGFYDASNYVDREEFKQFSQWLFENESAIKALEWIPKVLLDERENYEFKAREFFPNFKITEKDSENNMVEAPERAIHYPVYYIEPLKGNEAALGYDLASSQTRLAALNRASETGLLIASSPINLVQTQSKGVLLFNPIYKKKMKLGNNDERRRALHGFALGVFDVSRLLSNVIMNNSLGDITLYIKDTTIPDHSLLYGEPIPNEDYHYYKNIQFGERQWTLYFNYSNLKILPPWYVWIILIGAMLFISLIMTLVLLVTGSIEVVQHLVKTKTEELNQANYDLTEVNEKLQKASELAMSANQAKSLFLSNMSHEIRTPLTAILGNAEILEKKLSERSLFEEQSMSNRILTNGDHLMHLINDILDFSKIEANKLKIEQVDFNLDDVLYNIEKMFSAVADDKGIHLVIESLPKTPYIIRGDQTRIMQVMINLLSNAIKFTNKNGRVTLQVSFAQEKQLLICKVSDSGIGIEEDKLDKLFNVFVQVDESITRKHGGTGLGLSICKQLCLLMGGDLICKSQIDIGTTFIATVEVKYHSFDKPTKSVREEALKGNGYDTLNLLGKKKVLVAEDWKDNQAIILWHLKKMGIGYELVDNGVKAVEKAKSNQYDLILMDIQMPELDGIEATRLIREFGSKVPIIALSANAMKDQVEQYYEQGFTQFLAKPFRGDDLYQLVAKYLGDKAYEPVEEHEGFEKSKMFADIKEGFIERIPEDIKRLRKIEKDKDHLELLRFVHSLKSISATFSMETLTNLTKDIEILLNEHKNQKAYDKLSMLYELLNTIYQKEIEEQIDQYNDTHTPSTLQGHKRNEKILVVDDTAVSLQIAKSMLEKSGYMVDSATTGRQALSMIQAGKYHLILMDCIMPELDGYDTTREIRRDTDNINHNIPIVALTGHSTEEEVNKCINAGMNDVISKPIQYLSFIAKVEQWL